MTAENAAMPKVLGLYETHLTVADLKTSTEFYRDVVGLEPAASFEERNVAFLWVNDRKTGMLGLWETGTGPLKTRLHIAFRMTADGVLQAPDILRAKGVEPLGFTGEPVTEPVVLGWMLKRCRSISRIRTGTRSSSSAFSTPSPTGASACSRFPNGRRRDNRSPVKAATGEGNCAAR